MSWLQCLEFCERGKRISKAEPKTTGAIEDIVSGEIDYGESQIRPLLELLSVQNESHGAEDSNMPRMLIVD